MTILSFDPRNDADEAAYAWLSEHPPADAALRQVMGDAKYRVALATGDDAAPFAEALGDSAATGVIVVGTDPPTFIAGDGSTAHA